MAAKHPEHYLPSAFIQAVAYRGTSIRNDQEFYQNDARDITGPLDQQISQAYDFVKRNMKVAARKSVDFPGRQDLPQYDLIAVFEALTNAVAHRDYSVPYSKIRLHMFDDRLELYIPGSMIHSMSIEKLPHRQATRNEAIVSLLSKCPVPDDDELQSFRQTFMEKRGEGVLVILSRSEKLSGKTPEYTLHDDSELQLTIFAASCE